MSPRSTETTDAELQVLERDAQLADLEDLAREASSGQGRLVLVAGEAGVGKSTLVDEFRRRLRGADWLHGGCDGLFTPRPLGPLLDMADDLADWIVDGARTGTDRDRCFAGFLERVAVSHGLCVVVIEDIHWADEATLDLIQYVTRRIRDRHTLVIVTYRDEGLAANPSMQAVMGEVGRLPKTRRIQLERLSPAAVAGLCRSSGRDEGEAERLHALTGGNPYFLSEVLGVDDTFVSASVRDAVLARIAPLSKRARSALDTAALLGRRVDPAVFEKTVDDGPSALEELLAHGTLLEDGPMLRFRHELARLTVEENLPRHRRTPLHRRVLDVLMADGDTDASVLAFHAEGCADHEAVLAHAPRAAERAAALGSTREAAAQYQRALRFADGADSQVRAELYDGLADALARLEQFEAAMEARVEAIELWQEVGDVRREADSLRRQHWALSTLGRPKESITTCRRAIELLTPLGPSQELAWAQAALARVLLVQGDLSQARAWAEQAQELAEELGLDDVMSDALNTEGASRAAQDLPWEEQMSRALELAQSLPDAPLVARARYNTFCAYVMGQRLDEADSYYPQALAHAIEHDLDNFSKWLRREYAFLQLHMGRWEQAVTAARSQAEEVGESHKNPILPRIVISLIGARRGEDEDVDEVIGTAVHHAEGSGMDQYVVPARVARAEIAWLQGDIESARADIRGVRELEVEECRLQELIEVWAHRVGLDGSPVGHLEAVRLELEGDHDQAARAWDQLSCPYDAALALLSSRDETHLREAVVRFEALGATVPANMARQRMRSHGYGSIPTGGRASTRAHPKGLTKREQEVLALVADGLRNRDIAARLFLSPKTVAVHVSNIIRKLEVSTRTEAAAWAHHSVGEPE